MARGALEAKDRQMGVFYFPDKQRLLDAVLGEVQSGDTVLVKASHFMEFSEIVKAFQERNTEL